MCSTGSRRAVDVEPTVDVDSLDNFARIPLFFFLSNGRRRGGVLPSSRGAAAVTQTVTLDDGFAEQRVPLFVEVSGMPKISDAVTVGRVVGLWRYPVKSMGAEELSEADVTWNGLAGDRRWAFIRDHKIRNGFPWLTLRECENMSQYSPSFTNRTKPDTSPTVVRTPSGTIVDVTDPSLASELCPGGASVIRQCRGIFDTFPLSLITTQTIARLGEIVGDKLDVQRFRPNILVEATDDSPFQEDTWVGQVLRLGGVRMRVDKRDGRCVVITIDPETAERNPTILRTVVDERQGCLGVYGTTVEPGNVAVHDEVIKESDSR